MAKSFFILGSQSGFDMTTPEGWEQFRAEHNSRLPPGRAATADADQECSIYPPLPAIEHMSHAARQKKRDARKRQRQARKRNRKK